VGLRFLEVQLNPDRRDSARVASPARRVLGLSSARQGRSRTPALQQYSTHYFAVVADLEGQHESLLASSPAFDNFLGSLQAEPQTCALPPSTNISMPVM
jgi:hypothetical protein